MKRIIVFTSLLLLVLVGIQSFKHQPAPVASALKEGDIVFQTSKSPQSKYIILATKSQWSQCGIIIEKSDGLYVLEATGKLKLTPLQEFINRGKGKQWWAKRVIDKPIKVKYRHLLGRRYDTSFKPDNNLFYCSELLHHIYKTQFGIELCKYRKVSDYHLTGLKKTLRKRGINLNQEVVAPIDIYNSDKAKNI